MVIREITGEQPVSGRFLLIENQLRTAKNGSQFLALKIADRTGQLPVKVWSASEDLYTLLEVGKIIELHNVQAKLFKEQIQLEWDAKNSSAFQILSETDADYSEFLPQSPGNLKKYWNYLTEVMASIQDPLLHGILQVFFDDPKFLSEFLRVPAALKRHHVYIGGLLEHTAGVTALASAAASYYPLVDRDLLLTGAILHDIGKVRTYHVGNGFDGTDEGKLIGHLVLGAQMVEQAIGKVKHPDDEHSHEIRNKLIHLLVSHHGIMEWGSPIEPLTVEACILHHADNMDAQITKFLTIIRENQTQSEWTPFDPGLGRSIYLGKKSIVDENARQDDLSEGA